KLGRKWGFHWVVCRVTVDGASPSDRAVSLTCPGVAEDCTKSWARPLKELRCQWGMSGASRICRVAARFRPPAPLLFATTTAIVFVPGCRDALTSNDGLICQS